MLVAYERRYWSAREIFKRLYQGVTELDTSENSSVYDMLPDMAKRKDPGAVSMGRKRWKGLSAAERSVIARKAINARWARERAKKNKEVKFDSRTTPKVQ
jgi:hypothetical protein